MEFREFCSYIRDNLLDYFPEKFSQSEVSVEGTIKNNGVLRQGVSVHTPDRNIAPKLYLEGFYHEYERGVSLKEICQRIADEYQHHIVKDIPFTIDTITDYEKVKSLITTKVLSAKTNKSLLRERPSTRLNDFAVFYQIEVGNMPGGRASIPITNELLHRFNVPVSEIHKVAVENTERLFPSKLCAMESALFGLEENFFSCSEYHQPDFPMLILTNSELNGGASVIANPDVLFRVSEVINDSYYVLPSSVHEVIILPKTAVKERGMSPKEMGEMVRCINASEVTKEEQLSDHIYEFDKDTNVFEAVKDSKEKSMDIER